MYVTEHSKALDAYLASVGAADARPLDDELQASSLHVANVSKWAQQVAQAQSRWAAMSWHSLHAGVLPGWPSTVVLQQQGLQDARDGLRSGMQPSLLGSMQCAWQNADLPPPSIVAAVAVLYGVAIAGSLRWLRVALATILLSVLLVRLGIAAWCFYVRHASQRRAHVLLRTWQNHLASFDSTLEAFEDVVTLSLRRIKAAEVVHRGYHLDTLLPPIARLEANRASSVDDLRCVHLRVLLREVFAQLQEPTYVMNVRVTNDAAPSLLLLALSNQQKAARAALQKQLDALRSEVASSVSALGDAVTRLQRLITTVTTLQSRVRAAVDVDSALVEPTLPSATADTARRRSLPSWHHAHRIQVALDSANALLYAYKQDLVHGRSDDGATRARVAKFVDDAVTAIRTWEEATVPHVDGATPEAPALPPLGHDSVVLIGPAVELPAPVDPTVTEVFTALSTGRLEADEAPTVAPDTALLTSFHSVVDELHDVLDQRVLPPERVNGVEVEAPVVVAKSDVPLPPATTSSLARPALQLELQKAFMAAAFANDYVLGESDSE
ncbi:hypothetical protein SDRG_00154 [Saprolegnia diclina VS20]|uniref:Myosin-binding domain-containing protein n=1 Tax=Saprolegnia diclina (strain VS20) TaxID=1156394 RepID=T0QW24_SAPDV|nr:hypothetical protein SDRG_00154 [Saprolegnia diclina VS20]EQC42419.1 hypothetical protein SDRG_00154 [Saprolegnia diclina VS20]|eukprot:XP_008603842.1 hypothetical protein SDRG_00154 [Saprolegnia diclina VS20]